MMPYTRKVIMGTGLSLILALTDASARADDWYL